MNTDHETTLAVENAQTQPQRKEEQGQSLVEFAISAVIILILLMGVIDFGWAYFTLVSLNDAAQEGATYGSVCPLDAEGIALRLEQSASDPVNIQAVVGQNVLVCIPQLDGSGCGGPVVVGNDIQITVAYPYQIMTPFVGTIVGSQEILLHGRAKSRIVKTTCTQ